MKFADPQKNLQAFGLQTGMDVADFGAGVGHYALPAARLVGESGHVCAIDIQRDLVNKLKTEAEQAGLKNLDVVWGDLEKPGGTELDDETIDAVILSNILFQLKDKAAVLQEAYRVLRSGGKLLVIDWSDSHGGLGPPEDHLVDQETVSELAGSIGFVVGGDISPGAHHWGVILQKQ